MQNINLYASFDWKQIGEAGALLRLMINKKKAHISSFLEDPPQKKQNEKCAPFTREIIHHCSYWISHIKTSIWKSYRLITQSDWKLRKIPLLPINVYHGLVRLDGCFRWGKNEFVDLSEGEQTLSLLLLLLRQVRQQSTTLTSHRQAAISKPSGRLYIVWCI